MDWKFLIPVFIIASVFISGCTEMSNSNLDITGLATQIPQVKAFLDEHPNADITVVLWSSGYIKNNSDKIHAKCVPAIDKENSYYKVDVNEEGEIINAWLTSNAKEVVCIVREGGSSESENEIEVNTNGVKESDDSEKEESEDVENNEEEKDTNKEDQEKEEDNESDDSEKEDKYTVTSVISQDYDDESLSIEVVNKEDSQILVSPSKMFMKLINEDDEEVCKGLFSWGKFSCTKGCTSHVEVDEKREFVIKFVNCDLEENEAYDYVLALDNVRFEGSFMNN